MSNQEQDCDYTWPFESAAASIVGEEIVRLYCSTPFTLTQLFKLHLTVEHFQTLKAHLPAIRAEIKFKARDDAHCARVFRYLNLFVKMMESYYPKL